MPRLRDGGTKHPTYTDTVKHLASGQSKVSVLLRRVFRGICSELGSNMKEVLAGHQKLLSAALSIDDIHHTPTAFLVGVLNRYSDARFRSPQEIQKDL